MEYPLPQGQIRIDRKAQGMLKPRGIVGKAYGASIMGECADLKLVCEAAGAEA